MCEISCLKVISGVLKDKNENELNSGKVTFSSASHFVWDHWVKLIKTSKHSYKLILVALDISH